MTGLQPGSDRCVARGGFVRQLSPSVLACCAAEACQPGVWPWLAGLPLLLDAIHEDDAGPDERQEVCAIEASPPGLRHVEQLVGHQEPLGPGARALRHALAQSDRRERR